MSLVLRRESATDSAFSRSLKVNDSIRGRYGLLVGDEIGVVIVVVVNVQRCLRWRVAVRTTQRQGSVLLRFSLTVGHERSLVISNGIYKNDGSIGS